MHTEEEIELLKECGPGTPVGNLLRRYWTPALALGGDSRRRQYSGQGQVAPRGPRRVPRLEGQGRAHRRELPPPRRLALLRQKRREPDFAASTTAGSST